MEANCQILFGNFSWMLELTKIVREMEMVEGKAWLKNRNGVDFY